MQFSSPQATLYHTALLISLVINTAIGIFILNRYHWVTGTRHFLLAVFAADLWIISGILEGVLPPSALWDVIQYLCSLHIPVFLLAFGVEYTGKRFLRPRLNWSIIFVFLGLLTLPIFSNRNAIVGSGNGDWLRWLACLFDAAVLAIAAVIISSLYTSTRKKLNQHILILLAGYLIPFIAYSFEFFDLRFLPLRGLSLYALVVGFLLITFGMARFRVYNLKPVARDLIIEHLGDGILVLDHTRRIVDINPAAQKIFTLGEVDIYGSLMEQILPAWIQDWEDGEQSLIRSVESADGNGLAYFRIDISPLFDSLQKTSGHILKLHDVTDEKRQEHELKFRYHQMEAEVIARTQDLSDLIARLEEEIQERQQAEKALRINETKYRTIIEQANEAIMLINRDMVIIEVNPSLLNLTGLTSQEVVGRGMVDFLGGLLLNQTVDSEEQLQKVGGLLNSVWNMNNPHYTHTDEVVVQRPDGGIRDLAYSAAVIRNEFGNMLMLVGRDITESRRSERALRESEERYRLVVETSPDGIFLMDMDACILTANQYQAALFGCGSSQELVGKHLLDFLDPICRQKLLLEDRHTRWDTGQEVERIFHRKDGSQFIGEFRSTLIRDAANHPTAVVGIIRDITLRKQVEHDLIRFNRSLKVTSECNQTILRISDEATLLTEICRVIVEQGGYRFAWIGLQKDGADQITPDAYFGDGSIEMEESRLICMHSWREMPDWLQMFHTREPLAIGDLDEYISCENCLRDLDEAGIKTIYVLPLLRDGVYYGGLVIYSGNEYSVEDSDLLLLREMTDDLSYGIQTLRMRAERDQVLELLEKSNYDLSLAYDSTLEGWSHALELRERETAGHSQRVVDLTLKLAARMGISDETLVHIRRGALLHDIGKMGIPDNILLKPGKLTDEEWQIMKQHPVYSYRLLSNIPYLREAIDIPYAHHERWDGSGYPNGLRGEDIPMAARIFAVVDVWDALRSDRPYRKAWDEQQILSYIHDLSGKQFDPHVIEHFMELYRESTAN